MVSDGIGSRNRRQTECNQTSLNCRGAKEEKIQRILKGGDPRSGEDRQRPSVSVYIAKLFPARWHKIQVSKRNDDHHINQSYKSNCAESTDCQCH